MKKPLSLDGKSGKYQKVIFTRFIEMFGGFQQAFGNTKYNRTMLVTCLKSIKREVTIFAAFIIRTFNPNIINIRESLERVY